MFDDKTINRCRVAPGTRVNLADHPTDWVDREGLGDAEEAELKEAARVALERNRKALAEAQELLWASDVYSILVVLQGMDTSGKDGIIRHVMSGVNPQGCHVTSFKAPSAEELDHDFLWRCNRALPERGRIGIFNRSHYEEVLVVKVHPEFLDRQKLPPGERGKVFWAARYEAINAWERHLAASGTAIVKFFLHISKAEQKKRFLDRLDTPDKQWKFAPGDVAERGHWDAYMAAFEDALGATSTDWAPWYVVPADRKWAARALVADVLTTTIRSLDLRYPTLSDAQRAALAEARRALEAE